MRKLSLKINIPNEMVFNLRNIKYLVWCCWQQAYCFVESFCFIAAMHSKYCFKNGMKGRERMETYVVNSWHKFASSSWCCHCCCCCYWSNRNFCNLKNAFFTVILNFHQHSKYATINTPFCLQAKLLAYFMRKISILLLSPHYRKSFNSININNW